MNKDLHILVTGGAGYIGSHTCVSLAELGFKTVVVDNLMNASKEAIERVCDITATQIPFYNIDITNRAKLDDLFSKYSFGSVIHFAGLKAVGESVQKPMMYYENNILGTIQLLRAMDASGVNKLIFSSSATVYGANSEAPYIESAPLGATNPYGRTKHFIEEILRDCASAEDKWKIINLRYFNPVGAHISGKIGEDPIGIPNNLMPYIMQVAVGRREKLNVFGGDYDTPDGTCIRDYIHVTDLAEGHVAALRKIDDVQGCISINLGTGKGSSVLDVLNCASEAVGTKIPFEIVERRSGDVPVMYADVSSAKSFLGWKARLSLLEMCKHSWNWQKLNPNGYGSSE